MELLRYQLAELSAAHIAGPGEDNELEVEEERLSKAAAHRAAAEAVYEDLVGRRAGAGPSGKGRGEDRSATHPSKPCTTG